MMHSNVSKFAIGLGLALAISGSALAGTTAIGATTDGVGQELENKLVQAYGATGYAGSLATTLTLDNGISFVRVQDTGGTTPLNIGTSSAGGPGGAADPEDSTWADGVVRANVEVKVAGFTHKVFVDAADNGTKDTLLFGGIATVGASENVLLGPSFGFILEAHNIGDTATRDWSTNVANNADGNDHAITFEILGLGYKAWFVSFEDKTTRDTDGFGGSDWDYNDLGLEIAIVPLPAAAWAGMALLSGIAAVRRARKA